MDLKRLKLVLTAMMMALSIIACAGSIIYMIIFSIFAWVSLYQGEPLGIVFQNLIVSFIFIVTAVVSLIILVSFYSTYKKIKKEDKR